MSTLRKLWRQITLEVRGLIEELSKEETLDNLFWLFTVSWGLVMVVFFTCHNSTGPIFGL